MSYGIEVYDSVGATIFNSNNYVELAAFNGTVVGTDIGATPSGTNLLTLPDYLYGDDQHDYFGAGTNHDVHFSSPTPSYANNNQIATEVANVTAIVIFGVTLISYNPAPTGRFRTTGGTVISTITGATLTNVAGTGNQISDYANAYWLVDTSASMTSYRVASQVLNSQELNTDYTTELAIYARPVSGSYNGHFKLLYTSGRTVAITDMTGNNNTFEIMVAMTAEHYGSINSTTAHKLAGNAAYGLQGFTENTEQYTPNHSTTSFTTFDSNTYMTKALLTKGYEGGTAGTNATQSLGSLSSSSNKRFCRMNSTLGFKQKNAVPQNEIWWVFYKWYSNNSIELWWRQGGTGFAIENTMLSKAPYSVVEFGDGV
jgi:hypothetical protein